MNNEHYSPRYHKNTSNYTHRYMLFQRPTRAQHRLGSHNMYPVLIERHPVDAHIVRSQLILAVDPRQGADSPRRIK
jgi:hypothetical protein